MTKGIIGITGGSGFVGQHITDLLLANGYEVIVFTRNPARKQKKQGVKYAFWSPYEKKCDLRFLQELTAVIHLAGAGVADKRWTPKRKKEIVDSRVVGTRFMVEKLKEHAPQCKTLIAASAIGYYGPNRAGAQGPFKEDAPPYNDFLAKTCIDWEAASKEAETCMRRVVLRLGIVLGRGDGAFKELDRPQRFGIVPILGSGRQVVSWIHIDDLCDLLLWTLEKEDIRGVFNAVAPQPVSHKALMSTIARKRGGLKIKIPVPAPLLQIGLGEMATEVLKSCTVSDEKLKSAGFSCRYPDINTAVSSLV